MPYTLPWWIFLLPSIRPIMVLCFVIVAGTIQGRTTGKWPTLNEWCTAVGAVRPPTALNRGGRSQKQEAGPPSDQDGGPAAPHEQSAG
jgi:hypothetical protein